MADNITLNSTSGGATVAADDISSVYWPYSKVAFGADGTATLVTASVGLPVGDAGGSLTVDGTVAATQSGTWNVGTVTTVSAVTSITNTVTVSGSVTATAGAEKAEDAAHSTGATGNFVLAVRSDTAAQTAGTDGDYCALICDSTGKLHVNVGNSTLAVTQSGTWNVGTVTTLTSITNAVAVTDNSGSLTVDAPVGTPVFVRLSDGSSAITALPVTDNSGSLTVDNAALSVTGGGVESSALRVTLASDSTGVLSVDDNGSSLTVDGTVTANAGSGTFTVNDAPITSGGLSMSKTISAASTNATSVKASAGQVYSVQVMNNTTSAKYLKLYNKASAPTVGTDTPTKVLLVPGNSGGAGLVLNWDKGLAFSTGIAFATTTGIADSDTGAVGASEMTINLDYK